MAIPIIHPGNASVYQMNQGVTSNLNPKVNGATGNGAEAADAQREMLTEQLVTLNAKLMDLMTKKLEMTKKFEMQG